MTAPIEALQDAFETLRALALNPQHVENVRISRSPDRIDIQVTLHASSIQAKSRWARLADELHDESPLRGCSEQVVKQIREFRDHFAFEQE